MARLQELMKTISENTLTNNVSCVECGDIQYGPTDKFGAQDHLETLKEEGTKCKKCGSTNFKVTPMIKETNESITIDALTTLLEMVENDALNTNEEKELVEAIEAIFNNLLTESMDEEYEDEESEDEEYEDEDEESEDEPCCDWTGTEDELEEDEESGDMVCPACGSTVSEYEDEDTGDTMYSCNDDFCDSEDEDEYSEDEDEDEDEDEEMDEAISEGTMLNKSTSAEKKAAKMYAKSAAGKKSMKLVAKKRTKYATQIEKCAGKGKTFSFKAMTCVRAKKQR